MILTKRILRSDPVQSGVARLTALYIHLVHRTTHWAVVMPPQTERLLAEGRPFVGCFWHGRLIMMRAALPRDADIYLLISEHPDGRLISRAVTYLGVRTVSVSSRRGAFVALRAMQRILAGGHSVGITPDGPRGPRMRAKPGAIKMAQLSGAPIVPVSGSVNRRRILGSWDRFCLALPFGRGVILWGEPISVPREAGEEEVEHLRARLEERLNALTAEADLRFGQPSIEPATQSPVKERAGHARA